MPIDTAPAMFEPSDRIATFDPDGPLWRAHPSYAQGMFALDRLGKMAPQHSEWRRQRPFQAVLAGDQQGDKQVR